MNYSKLIEGNYYNIKGFGLAKLCDKPNLCFSFAGVSFLAKLSDIN